MKESRLQGIEGDQPMSGQEPLRERDRAAGGGMKVKRQTGEVGRIVRQVWTAGLLVLLILSGFSVPVAAQEGSHLLDGQAYVGRNGEKGKSLAEYEDEEIVFADGMFTSVSCEPYNFASSPYTARVEGNKIRFEAVTHSPTHGRIAWQGVIDGEKAEVEFVWTKERWYWDIHREYWFRGVLRK